MPVCPSATCSVSSPCSPSLGLPWRFSLPAPVSLHPAAQVSLMGSLSSSDLMSSRRHRFLLAKWLTCVRHQERMSSPLGMLSRVLPSASLRGRQKVSTLLSSSTFPEPGQRRGSLKMTCTHSGGHRSLRSHAILPPSFRGAKSCTCSASSGPWQSLRVTGFPPCPLVNPAAVHLGQLVVHQEELHKKGIRSPPSLPTSQNLLHWMQF